VLLGLWLHRPLARVPENALKFGVGVMLAAFGTFWVGEGIGLEWPGADWAILALIGVFLMVALALVQVCIRLRKASVAASKAPGKAASAAAAKPGVLAVIGSELFGLFFDDGWLAAGILVWVLAAWFGEPATPLSAPSTGCCSPRVSRLCWRPAPLAVQRQGDAHFVAVDPDSPPGVAVEPGTALHGLGRCRSDRGRRGPDARCRSRAA